MTTQTSFSGYGRFFDDANYPYGFARSGDFSRNQADLLEQYGNALKALHQGDCQPRDEQEARFVEVCQGQQAAQSPLEKAWLLYLTGLKKRNVYFSASAAASVAEQGNDNRYDDDD